jgi:AraC-like DNA-binding protein
LVSAITEAIANEATQRQLYHQELTQQLVNTLLTVVARNISLRAAGKTSVTPSPPLDILQYIHRRIYQPEKLKAEAIAAHFRLSLHYVSEYFKKHTGQNLQQYIIGYKLSLAETRLLQSDLRLKEIANELGFTDESHLTKIFKKYRGVTPTQYRKSRREAAR